jgi:hypothetical protein
MGSFIIERHFTDFTFMDLNSESRQESLKDSKDVQIQKSRPLVRDGWDCAGIYSSPMQIEFSREALKDMIRFL